MNLNAVTVTLPLKMWEAISAGRPIPVAAAPKPNGKLARNVKRVTVKREGKLPRARKGTQVAKIRALKAKGLKGSEIAKKLKLNPGTVWHALNG